MEDVEQAIKSFLTKSFFNYLLAYFLAYEILGEGVGLRGGFGNHLERLGNTLERFVQIYNSTVMSRTLLSAFLYSLNKAPGAIRELLYRWAEAQCKRDQIVHQGYLIQSFKSTTISHSIYQEKINNYPKCVFPCLFC